MSGTFGTLTALAWRNLWRNYRRTSITLIVVAVGLWSILFFNSFMIAWIQSGKDSALRLLTASGQIHAVGYLDDPSVDYTFARPGPELSGVLNGPNVEGWAIRLPIPGVIQSEYKTLPVTFVGVEPDREKAISSIPGKLVEGRYLNGPADDGIVIGLHMAERLETGLGRRIILMATGADEELAEQSFEIVGLFDADQGTEDFYAFTGLQATQDFLRLDTKVSQIAVQLVEGANLEAQFDAIRAAAPDLDVRDWKQLNILLAATDAGMHTFIGIWLGIVFSLMAIGIINTQLMAVFERTQEFGLLRALGMKPRLLLLLVAIESALLVGLGVIVGAAVALATIWSLQNGIDLSAFARALEMFQGGEVLYLAYHLPEAVEFSLLIWVLGVIVALWPARRAARSNPVEAMARKT